MGRRRQGVLKDASQRSNAEDVNSRRLRPVQEMLGPGDDDPPRQTSQLQLEHAAAEGSQSIVAAPLILLQCTAGAARRAPRFRHLLDETRREHTLNGAVERA